ncbi:hypothetical protein [Brachyspira hyodysenteriae]|uniref:hypothetical protein n=1 Tax=Brachyspira hyodysenteriae TaxID=159 RepID=UPI0022CD9FC5|nr:hypothetical protein [Brachyspira hyodysenteriae]MDA0053111.1 hypothetical protein [Brachyspira hyodysenteriae]
MLNFGRRVRTSRIPLSKSAAFLVANAKAVVPAAIGTVRLLAAKEPNLSKDFPILSKPLSKSVVLSLSFPNASIAWEASALI